MRTIKEITDYVLNQLNTSEYNVKRYGEVQTLLEKVYKPQPEDRDYTSWRDIVLNGNKERLQFSETMVSYNQKFYDWLTGNSDHCPKLKSVGKPELTEKVRRTQKETIIECLRTLGPQEIKDIVKNTGIKYHSVCQILSKNKGSVFTKRFDKWYVTEDLDRSDKVDPVSK